MNLFADMRTHVIAALDDMVRDGQLPDGLTFDNVAVEPPREVAHGDMATNAAMVLAKPAGLKPRDLAQTLAARLGALDVVESAEVAGPGFLNLRLSSALWSDVIVRAQQAGFGASKLGAGQRVNVEYVSANPTGPLHVGHTRGAVFGDALANLLAFAGYDVTREYYINDGGSQVDVLARSVYLRYLEAHGQEVSFPDGTYPGDYLVAVGEELKARVGDAYVDQPEDVWLAEVRAVATEAMMGLVRDDLASLGVKMDVFYSEKSLYGTGRIEEALKELDAKGLIYKGTLEPPKGKLPDDWEPREQTLFRSTAYGDDVDRPVMKSDGAWTYFAPDIAYHWDKIDRGFDQLIDVFGADHGGYVKRMKAAVAALSDEQVPLDVKLCQLVRLYDKGQPFKMSKRAGTFVMLSDVVGRVGKDVVRFLMLTRKNDAPLDFDLAKAVEESRDNPVWYVQYTHARIRSVMRKADGMGVAPGAPNLTHPAEIEVAKKLAEFPRIIEIAAKGHEPHRIAFYLGELAQVFNSLWNAGDGDHAIRFLHDSDPSATAGKIPLPLAVSVVISAGLGILGVDPVEEMR